MSMLRATSPLRSTLGFTFKFSPRSSYCTIGTLDVVELVEDESRELRLLDVPAEVSPAIFDEVDDRFE
jgi:hypothetical protein